jgi:hypothetical protein
VQPKSTFLSRFCVKFLEVAGAGLASAICAYVLGQAGAPRPAPTSATVAQVASVSQISSAQVPPAQVSSAQASSAQAASAQVSSAQVSSAQVSSAQASSAQASSAQVSPANDEAARMAREDHALLMELARKKDAETPSKPEGAAPAPTAALAPKALKPAPVAQPRRAQKPEQVIEIKPQATEPLPILPSVTVAAGAPRTAAPPARPTPPAPSADAALGRDGAAASTPNGGEADRPLFARLKLVPSWFSPANDRPNDRPVADVPRPPMPVGEPLRSTM